MACRDGVDGLLRDGRREGGLLRFSLAQRLCVRAVVGEQDEVEVLLVKRIEHCSAQRLCGELVLLARTSIGARDLREAFQLEGAESVGIKGVVGFEEGDDAGELSEECLGGGGGDGEDVEETRDGRVIRRE